MSDNRVKPSQSIEEKDVSVRSKRRQGGRRSRREARQSVLPLLPWRSVQNPRRPIEVLSADQIEAIHHASLRVLSEAGIKVLGSDARHIYRTAGADVDNDQELVRFDPAMVEDLVAKVPSVFTIKARNPKKSLT
ncbi:MAG: trimethylamine methyltransferase family protein, partial [Kiloniellales bacterium]|nr:trimethylamine methyltransferase family protein [Kiloniellales bacterium]